MRISDWSSDVCSSDLVSCCESATDFERFRTMLGSKTLRLATVTAVASLLALPAFVGEAHAAAKAFSSLHVEDLIASEGGTQFDPGEFDNPGITHRGQHSATLRPEQRRGGKGWVKTC